MYSSQNLLYKLVRKELERLDVSKKYTGFKYLVDLVVISFDNEPNDLAGLFNLVANVNSVTADAVEHDVKHMLMSCLKNSEVFKLVICAGDDNAVDSKQLVVLVLNHIRKSII